MNHNLTTERSHLGVFSTTSYITIGDQYGKKSDADPRLQGKQFTADFPKAGIAGARPNNSLFEREHKWLYGGGEKCVPLPPSKAASFTFRAVVDQPCCISSVCHKRGGPQPPTEAVSSAATAAAAHVTRAP